MNTKSNKIKCKSFTDNLVYRKFHNIGIQISPTIDTIQFDELTTIFDLNSDLIFG